MNHAIRLPRRRRWLGALALVTTLGGSALAGPLHDPFMERFQVGTWTDPATVELVAGFPAGLLAPALADSAWLAAADRVLGTTADPDLLTRRFLRHLHPADGGAAWLRAARAALGDLAAGRVGATDEPFLQHERLVMAFGRALAAGDHAAAARLAGALVAGADRLGIPARESLVWRLRRQAALGRLDPARPDSTGFWPEFATLGSFDTNNAWALWVAMRRAADRPVLPPDVDQQQLGEVLGRLAKARFSAAELYASALPADWQAGLGGILLEAEDLPAHFARFPAPPADFTRQGWWVRGQRRLHPGQAAAYENLAGRADLSPGWQLDLWRRASERRLLTGAWVEGLADLEHALRLAGRGHGTAGLRQRLWQWTEQALVLALAQDDVATARRIHRLGLDHLAGDDRAAFAAEVGHWTARLEGPGDETAALGTDLVDRARLRVTTGDAPAAGAATAADKAAFLAVAERRLWETWYRWGLVLADPAPVTGERRERAVAYGRALRAGQGAPDAGALADSALAVIALRFRDRPWLPTLLRKAVDADAERFCGGQTAPWPSPVPDLLPEVRGSELDRHALLGFCLAAGDMRGIIGLAYELPGRGLTRAQKRLFLYPLPAAGPIRDAVMAAENEPALLLAVARNESLFEPAVRSRAGALGWMQIMPFHYPQKGALRGPENWRVPAMSIARGDGLLTENRQRYRGDPYRVLAAYNAGPVAASRWDRQLGGAAAADVYLAWIGYPETRAYVEKVLIDREIYTAIISANYGVAEPAADNE